VILNPAKPYKKMCFQGRWANGHKVSLIGRNLGGVFVRAVALRQSRYVRTHLFPKSNKTLG